MALTTQAQLERIVSQKVAEITNRELVANSMYLAQELGKAEHGKGDFGNSHWEYVNGKLVVKVHAYGMGDKELKVEWTKKEVFSLKELVNDKPSIPGNVVKGPENEKFEVRKYSPGPWIETITNLARNVEYTTEQELKRIYG